MNIFAVCLVKNEGDVIEQCLRAAHEWCDRIFVEDNGSTDDTWEKVVALARTHGSVVPFRREVRPFQAGLRGQVFRACRPTRRGHDWWCILDADEFYIDDPRSFLKEVPARHDSVWGSSFEYCFTELDVARYREDPSAYADDVPVHEKCRYYANSWSELRFFRDRENLVWPAEQRQPGPLRRPFPRRIRLRHFPYRSPHQIETRLATRSEPSRRGFFAHETRAHWSKYSSCAAEILAAEAGMPQRPQSWEERVVDSAELHFDAHDGVYVSDESSLPPVAPQPTGRIRGLLRRIAVRA